MKVFQFLFALFAFEQTVAQDVQSEINDQVWKPFIQYFNSYDADGFLSVHSKEVVRSPRDAKKIFGWDEYLRNQKEGDERDKTSGRKRSLELHFTERIADNNLAAEVGIYRTTSIDSKGQRRDYYGRFHVVLRKENGTWKILVDTDSSEGGAIGEKDFLAGKGIE